MNGTAAPYELAVGQAAVLLETSKDTVRRMVDRGELLARHSPGGHRLIPREAALAMKLRLENAGDPPDSPGVAENGDRPATGDVERRERHAEDSGGDSDGGGPVDAR